MSFAAYMDSDSAIHRLAAGRKLVMLILIGSLVFFIDKLWLMSLLVVGVIILYRLAKIPFNRLWAQLRPVWWIFVLIFVFQLYTKDAAFAALVVFRFAALLLAASLVTLTTPVSAMLASMESVLRRFSWLGINAAKVSLGLSLALRFIPMVAAISAEVREAQKARGLERSLIAVALPTIIRTLKMADDIANAIDARGYNPDN